jgi:mono/diheme cytochrome c family protein
MVVRRGMPRPPSFHDPRLVKSPAGYFVNVMTKGFGRMDSYADRLSPDDRWAVAAYIRALQASQDAPLSALTPSERERLNAEPPATSTRTALGDLASW